MTTCPFPSDVHVTVSVAPLSKSEGLYFQWGVNLEDVKYHYTEITNLSDYGYEIRLVECAMQLLDKVLMDKHEASGETSYDVEANPFPDNHVEIQVAVKPIDGSDENDWWVPFVTVDTLWKEALPIKARPVYMDTVIRLMQELIKNALEENVPERIVNFKKVSKQIVLARQAARLSGDDDDSLPYLKLYREGD